jgi:hypothetical protein
VRHIASVTENEMVLAFLQAELKSPNYRDLYLQVLAALSRDENLVWQADLELTEENSLRARLLQGVRGFKSNGAIFRCFPDDVMWRRVELNRDDFSKLTYMGKQPTWRGISDGTRSVIVGARNISSGVKSNASIEGVVAALKAGENFPPLIAVEKEDQLVLLEGHTRATAYVIAGHEPVSAIVGRSPSMHKWYWY